MNYTEVINKMANDILENIKMAINTQSYSDKTFTAKIVEKINDEKYKVLYCGSTYTVSSSILCEIDDMVRVCAPCNNWKNLFITENKRNRKNVMDIINGLVNNVNNLLNKVKEIEIKLPQFMNRYRGTNPNTGTIGQGAIPPIVLSCIGSGKKLISDPEFGSGMGQVGVYSNATYKPTLERVQMTDTGNTTDYVIKFTHTQIATPGLGGFVTITNSKANGLFIQVFRAKLPVGYRFEFAENSVGNNKSTVWYTETQGTGKWEWYVRANYCGTDGSFSSFGHVYIIGNTPTSASPLIWYLSGVQVYQVSLI